jgi:predicted ribosome quality control (RQC) complex YloA/Tae2 family protein
MTMAIEDKRVNEEEEALLRRIERLEQAINAMIGAARLRHPGEALCALIQCIDNVVLLYRMRRLQERFS